MALLKHRSPCLLFAFILLINKYAELAEAVSVEQGSNTKLNMQARFNDTSLNETLLKVDAEEQPGDEQTEKVDDFQPRLVVRRVNFDEIDDEYDGIHVGNVGNFESINSGNYHNINSGNFQNVNGMYLTQGHYLRIKNHKGLRLIVKSPYKEQNIQAINGVVTINGKTVCTDTRSLPTQPTYQKTPDGAMWYTNLSLGSPMSSKEIEEFKAEEELRQKKKEDRRREKERRKSEKAAAKAERKERKRVQKELKRTASTLKKESDRMAKEMKRQGKAVAKEWERNEKDWLRQKERAKDGAVKLYEKFTRGSESESDDENSDWDD